MGLFLCAAYVVQTYGLKGTTPGKNAFFTAAYCVIVPFLYWVVDHVRPDKFNVLAAVLCVIGIGSVSWDGGFALTWGGTVSPWPAGFCTPATSSRWRSSPRAGTFSPSPSSSLPPSCAAGQERSLPRVSPSRGFPARLGSPCCIWPPPPPWDFCSRMWGSNTASSAAALLLSLEAPFGVAFSVIFTGESPTPFMYLGFVLIFAAVVCSETKFSFLKPKAGTDRGRSRQ